MNEIPDIATDVRILRTEIHSAEPKQILSFYSIESQKTGEVSHFESILRERSKILDRKQYDTKIFEIAIIKHLEYLRSITPKRNMVRELSLAISNAEQDIDSGHIFLKNPSEELINFLKDRSILIDNESKENNE